MSRSTDVAFIENQIAALRGEIQEVQQVYAGYHKEVGQRIRDVLEAAEVYDQVRSLEEVRSGVQQKAQAKANQLQAKINQLAATRQFLLNREEAEPEEVTPTEDTPTEETPDEVSENGKAPVKLLTELDVLRQQVQEAQAKKPVETRPELKKVPVPPNFG
jgi:chromosome segregation ATPase